MQATGTIFFSHPGHPAEAAPGQHNPIRPLLELTLVQTGAQGGYVYRSEGGGTSAELMAWAGLAPHDAAGRHPDKAYPAVWTSAQCTPVVLHENAWNDWRFRSLVEFERHRFEGVASVPLMDGERLVGVANFCRSRRLTLAPRDLSLLLNLGVPLGSLLIGAAVRARLESELQQTKQQLEDRKLLGRRRVCCKHDTGGPRRGRICTSGV